MTTATPTKFKETDIGLIPKEWDFDRLGNHCKILGGKRLPKEDSLTNQKTDHPYIRITDLGDFGVNESGLKYISDQTHAKIKKYIIESGDIYISYVGTIGLVGLVKDNLSGANLTENAVRLTKLNGLDNLFLGYYLKSESGQNQIRQNTVGAVQLKLPIYGVENIKLPIPELTEQKEIGEILSSLDDKIELNRKINVNLEKLASSLFKKWFVDIGDKLPDGWKITELKNILELNYGKALKAEDRTDGRIKVYGSSGIVGFNDIKLVDGPGIIVGRKGNVGSVFWSDDDFYPIDTTYFVKSKLPLTYCYHLLKNQTFINGDSVVPGLNRDQAYRTEVVLPSTDALERFDAVASDLRKSIVFIEHEIETLVEIRDSILPRLMNGKIRV